MKTFVKIFTDVKVDIEEEIKKVQEEENAEVINTSMVPFTWDKQVYFGVIVTFERK